MAKPVERDSVEQDINSFNVLLERRKKLELGPPKNSKAKELQKNKKNLATVNNELRHLAKSGNIPEALLAKLHQDDKTQNNNFDLEQTQKILGFTLKSKKEKLATALDMDPTDSKFILELGKKIHIAAASLLEAETAMSLPSYLKLSQSINKVFEILLLEQLAEKLASDTLNSKEKEELYKQTTNSMESVEKLFQDLPAQIGVKNSLAPPQSKWPKEGEFNAMLRNAAKMNCLAENQKTQQELLKKNLSIVGAEQAEKLNLLVDDFFKPLSTMSKLAKSISKFLEEKLRAKGMMIEFTSQINQNELSGYSLPQINNMIAIHQEFIDDSAQTLIELITQIGKEFHPNQIDYDSLSADLKEVAKGFSDRLTEIVENFEKQKVKRVAAYDEDLFECFGDSPLTNKNFKARIGLDVVLDSLAAQGLDLKSRHDPFVQALTHFHDLLRLGGRPLLSQKFGLS